MDIKLKNIIRRIALGVCAAAVVVCIVLLGVFLGAPQKGKNDLNLPIDDKNNSASTAADPADITTAETYDEYHVLDGVANPLAAQWETAMTAAKNGKKVYVSLETDWNAVGGSFGTGTNGFVNGNILLPVNAKVVFNIGNHTINKGLTAPNTYGGVFALYTGSDLTLEGTGTITGAYGASGNVGAAIAVYSGAKLTLNGVNIKNNKTAGAAAGLYINNGTAVMNGGSVDNCDMISSSLNGGGVWVNGGSFTMNGGVIKNCDAYSGGGVLVSSTTTTSSTFTMNGGVIENNTAQLNAGAVYVMSSTTAKSTFNMNGGVIRNNRTTISTASYGGAICITSSSNSYLSDVTLKNGTFTDNSVTSVASSSGATSGGGAIALGVGNLTIENCDFRNNIGALGGAIQNFPNCNATVDIKGSTFIGNDSSAGAGGGLAMMNAGTLFKLSNTTVTGNVASGTGGILASCQVHLSGKVIISGNESTGCNNDYGKNLHIPNFNAVWIVVDGALTGSKIGYGAWHSNGSSGDFYVGITSSTYNGGSGIAGIHITGYKANNSGVSASKYFYSDITGYFIDSKDDNGDYTTIEPYIAKGNVKTLTWEYELNGTWATADASVYDSTIASTGDGTLIRTYDGIPITGLRASDGTSTYTATLPSGGLVNAGEYTIEPDALPSGTIFANRTANIKILKKEITVSIGTYTNKPYGEVPVYDSMTASPALLTGETVGTNASDSVRINVIKTAGTDVRTYTLTGTFVSSDNYIVTEIISGSYQIVPRPVTIIINNDKKVYGASSLASTLGITENTTVPQGETSPLGGWKYDTNSKKFLSMDLVANNMPFSLKAMKGTAASDPTIEYTATESAATGFVFPAAGDYPIIGKALNKNYNITFKSADGTSTNGKFTITKADITVTDSTAATATDPSKYDLGSVSLMDLATDTTTYPNGKKDLIIPSGKIVLAGDKSATKNLSYIVKTKTMTSVPAENDTNWANAIASTASDGTFTPIAALQKNSRGTHEVYFKITAANHNAKIVLVTLKITPSTLTFDFEIKGWKYNDGSGKYDIANNPAAGKNPVYAPDAVVEASAKYTTPSTGTVKYAVYYLGTDTGNTYGAWNSATDVEDTANNPGFTADGSKSKTLGVTAMPSDAGTYKATLVNLETSDYELQASGGAGLSTTFTIDKAELAAPTFNVQTGIATDTDGKPIYTGNEIYFQFPNYAYEQLDLCTLTATANGNTPVDKNSTFTSTNNNTQTPRRLYMTNADKYSVKFKIKTAMQKNYKWATAANANSSGEVALSPEIVKKPLTVTFTSPSGSQSSGWDWKPDVYATSGGQIKFAVTGAVTPTGASSAEAVTLNLHWYKKPENGASISPSENGISVNATTQLEELEIKTFTKGEYYIYATLASDTSGANVNKNYTIKTDTDGYPSHRKKFSVGDGSASVSDLVWKYSQTLDGTTTDDLTYVKGSADPNDDTKLYYKLGTDGNAVIYKLYVDANDTNFPEYLEIETNYSISGFDSTGWEAGTGYLNSSYSEATEKESGRTEFVTKVLLKIKDQDSNGNPYDYEFESGKSEYTFVDKKHAVVEFKWKIEKGKIDYSTLVWGYTVGTGSDFNEFRKVNTGTDAAPVWVYEVDIQDNKIIPTLKADSIPTSIITVKNGGYSGNGIAGIVDSVTPDGQTLSTSVEFNLVDKSFEAPTKQTINWKVTKETLKISGWNNNGSLKDGTASYGTPVVESDDDANIANKVEYVYTYNGTEYKGLAGLKALYDIADNLNGGEGGAISVSVKAVPKEGYQLDAAKEANGDYEVPLFTVGNTAYRVTVTPTTDLEMSYGDSEHKFEFAVTRKSSGSTVDVKSNVYTIWVYNTDSVDNITDSTAKTKLEDTDFSKLNSGKYVLRTEINSGYVTDYIVLANSEYFTVTINKIELDLPVLASNPVFNGVEQDVTELLDEGYKAIKDLVEVTGQNSARNKGNYTLIITIKDTDNYVWKASGKSATKYVLAEDIPAPESVRVSDSEVNIGWQMLPYAIVVTQDMWSVSKEKDAKLLLPDWLNAFLDVADPADTEKPMLSVGYNYYEGKVGGTPIEELSNGLSVWASAVISGTEVDRGNIIFADSGINETSTRVAHTVVIPPPPKSKIAAAASTALNFVKKNWLWFAIGGGIFLFLLLLIIILAATRRKRKEKAEERKLEKERKAEEKERKEEEKRRREQEREEAKAKAEAERELQKAKAEAELAKMRAEMGMVGAGAMAMQAMQPQQQQQPMQPMQPMQQAMPQQQMQMPQQPQYPQQMQQPYYPQQQMPMQQNGADMNLLMAKLEAEFAKLRADQQQTRNSPVGGGMDVGTYMLMRMEADIAQLRNGGQMPYMPYQAMGADKMLPGGMQTNAKNGEAQSDNTAAIAAAAAAAAIAAINAQNKTAEPKEVVEAESKPTVVDTPTVYPPDAVITTTTTVDTTKKPVSSQPQRITREGENGSYFDIDGFYDAFEENK